MIRDFEEMILECVNGDSKSHIREAVRCYQTGAYRAAIITSYVSVCFDLIAKLRHLASCRDQAADTLTKKLDNLQQREQEGDPDALRGLLSFEHDLLENFQEKFGYFDHHEIEDLRRLRHDRHRCAHPTYCQGGQPYSPTAELARLHIFSALNHVLIRPSRQGKAALADLQKAVLSKYFPEKVDDAVVALRSTALGNARKPLIYAFVDDLVSGYLNETHLYYKNNAAACALDAAVKIHPITVLPKLTGTVEKLAKSDDSDVMFFAGLISLSSQQVSEAVDESTRVILSNWFKIDGKTRNWNAVKHALQISWLRGSALDVLGTLSAEQLENGTDLPPEMISRAAELYAAELYASAENWGDVNALTEPVAPLFANRYSIEDIKLVLESAHSPAVQEDNSGFKSFISQLYDKNNITDVDLGKLLDQYGLENFKRGPQVDDN